MNIGIYIYKSILYLSLFVFIFSVQKQIFLCHLKNTLQSLQYVGDQDLFIIICELLCVLWEYSGGAFILLASLFEHQSFPSLRILCCYILAFSGDIRNGLMSFLRKWTQHISAEFELGSPIYLSTIRTSLFFLRGF